MRTTEETSAQQLAVLTQPDCVSTGTTHTQLGSQKSPLQDVLHRAIITPQGFFFSSVLWLPSNVTPCAQETASS